MKLLSSILGLLFSMVLILTLAYFLGEDPFFVLTTIYQSVFQSKYDFGQTLVYSTPFLLSGISVAFAYKGGLFNVGAEGQLLLGALAASSTGILFPSLSPLLGVTVSIFAGMTAGGCWGMLAGYLKARHNCHEVISTLMLNFLAAGLVHYLVLHWLKDPLSQNPQSLPVPSSFMISPFSFFSEAPVNLFLVIAIVLVIVCSVYLNHTPQGYQIRLVGENEIAARTYKISIARVQMKTMFIAGAIAGLIGVEEILVKSGFFKVDFSPGYGFSGIGVAFLSQGNLFVCIISAFLFGILQKSGNELALMTQFITSDVAILIQGLILLWVSASGLWEKLFKLLFRKQGGSK